MVKDWHVNGYFDPLRMQGFYEAISLRESCRSFASAPATEPWNELCLSAKTLALPGTRMVLGLCDQGLFGTFFAKLLKFQNVQRFAAILTTSDRRENVVNAGVSGEMLMLNAVRLGMGGVWVAGSYSRKALGIELKQGEKVRAVLALGIPKTPPAPPLQRKRKPLPDLCSANFHEAPGAFREIALAVQAAPSAMNLQPWRLSYEAPRTLFLCVKRDAQKLDLGIALCHAVLALGNTPAQYELSDDGLTVRLTLSDE